MAKSASYPVISLGLDASGITKGLNAARNILKSGMSSLSSAVSTPLFGVALANQAAEFSGKITRLFGEPFRQLMAQEDMTSRFSVLAGGTDKAARALDQFKSISRETGLSLGEMSTSLDTLLQGQFSFAGAVAQIEDLSQVASILGEGSLPMLAQAAAKFRANAFAGFEDLNALAASGLPVFDALAKQLGVTAEEARNLARGGMVTGLQARNALNGAAAMGAGANGGQQEQTLSGVVSRLKEGLNQTLAAFGGAVAKVINVQALLERFRGFVGVVQTLLEQAFGPLKNVVGGDGGNLKRAFADAQAATIEIFKKIGEGFFKFLEGLEKVTNGLASVFNWVNGWIGTKFSDDQEKSIEDFRKANQIRVVVPQIGPQDIPMPREQAIKELRNQGKLPAELQDFAAADFGIGKMRNDFDALMAGAGKALGAPAKELNEADMAAAKLAENLAQAGNAMNQFNDTFANAFDTPVDEAAKKLQMLDTVMNQAFLQGVADPQALFEKGQLAANAIAKPVLDFANQFAQQMQQVKVNSVSTTGTAQLVESIGKAQIGGQVAPDVQNRIAQAVEATRDQTNQNNEQLKQAVNFLRSIANQPKGNPIGKI